jgi:hypothetical protein
LPLSSIGCNFLTINLRIFPYEITSYLSGYNSGRIFYCKKKREEKMNSIERFNLLHQQNTNHIQHLHLEHYIQVQLYHFHQFLMFQVIVFQNAIVVLFKKNKIIKNIYSFVLNTFDIKITRCFNTSIIINLTSIFSCNDKNINMKLKKINFYIYQTFIMFCCFEYSKNTSCHILMIFHTFIFFSLNQRSKILNF